MDQIPPYEKDDFAPTVTNTESDKGSQTNPDIVAVSIDVSNYQNDLTSTRSPKDSKKYRLISVGHLWAEQFAIEIDVLNRRFWNFLENCDFEISIIFHKIDQFQSQIARLTDLSQKWACTF